MKILKYISVCCVVVLIISFSAVSVAAESVYTWNYEQHTSWVDPIPFGEFALNNYNYFTDDNVAGFDYRYCIWPRDWYTTPSYLTGMRITYNLGLFEDDFTPFVFHRDRTYYFEFQYMPQVKYGVGDSWLYGVDLNDKSSSFRDGYLSFNLTFASNWESDTEYKFYYVEIPWGDVVPASGGADWNAFFRFVVDGVDVDGFALNQIDVTWNLNGKTAQGLRIDGNNWTVTSKTESDIQTDIIRGEIRDSTDQINQQIQDSTNQITGEIEESTDKIINGYDSNPEAPQGSDIVDTSAEMEKELLESTTGPIASMGGILNNLDGYLTKFSPAIVFIGNIFNKFIADDATTDFYIASWFRNLCYVGLTLGLVSFVLNLAPAIGRKISEMRGKRK